MKSALARLGIRGFKPHLRKAPERLAGLRTAEGTGLPANIIEEFPARHGSAGTGSVSRSARSRRHVPSGSSGAPDTGPHAMVRLLARGLVSASRRRTCWCGRSCRGSFEDRRAVGALRRAHGIARRERLKRREKGLAKAGNARVRRGLIQLAWRFLMFQKDSALAQWYRTRTEGPSGARKTTMIVATGAQAADRAVAPGHDRRGAGRCRAAAGGVSNTL